MFLNFIQDFFNFSSILCYFALFIIIAYEKKILTDDVCGGFHVSGRLRSESF